VKEHDARGAIVFVCSQYFIVDGGLGSFWISARQEKEEKENRKKGKGGKN
jgi:hypothetical protein